MKYLLLLQIFAPLLIADDQTTKNKILIQSSRSGSKESMVIPRSMEETYGHVLKWSPGPNLRVSADHSVVFGLLADETFERIKTPRRTPDGRMVFPGLEKFPRQTQIEFVTYYIMNDSKRRGLSWRVAQRRVQEILADQVLIGGDQAPAPAAPAKAGH